MMKTRFLVFAALLFLLSPGVHCNAASQEVVAVGESGVSFADALRQAQRDAVEQVVGVFIHSESEVQKYELKKDRMLSRAEGYVTRFSYLEKKRVGQGYHVKIRAAVSKDKIKDDLIALKILLDSMERPKLMVLIEEKTVGFDAAGMRIAETEVSSLLKSKGFELVDQAQLQAAVERDKARQALAGDMKAARSLGLLFGAQYVILGKSVIQDAGEVMPGTRLRSLQAALQAKVVNSQTGSLLGSVVKNGVASHISSVTGASLAARKAAQGAVEEYLVDAITRSFQDYLHQGGLVQVYVRGVGSFRSYKKVKGAIEPLDGVASLQKRGWNRSSGLLVLDMRYRGSVESLADALDGRKVGDGRLQVEDLAPNRLDLVVARPGGGR
ncbi:MAG: hypothetical protein JRJ35_15470 [Deltaproteobacteria bacterium]|nr:hypothetical protein [Deltaproteobacteria bacterium]